MPENENEDDLYETDVQSGERSLDFGLIILRQIDRISKLTTLTLMRTNGQYEVVNLDDALNRTITLLHYTLSPYWDKDYLNRLDKWEKENDGKENPMLWGIYEMSMQLVQRLGLIPELAKEKGH